MIIKGDCKSQHPAAVYTPLEQGAGPRSIQLSFLPPPLSLPLLSLGSSPQAGRESAQLQETFITGLLGGSVGHGAAALGSCLLAGLV